MTISYANLDGSTYGIYSEYDVNSTFSHSHDSAGGSSAYGFYDDYSNNDSYVSDTADTEYYGFYLYGDGEGITQVTDSSTSTPSAPPTATTMPMATLATA